MELVKIVKQRIVIDENVYPRYFVDTEGRVVGIPTGLSFTIKTSTNGKYASVLYASKYANKLLDSGTCYADSTERLCEHIKKQISNHLERLPDSCTYSHRTIGKRRTEQNYAGVITPEGVSFYIVDNVNVGFSVNVIDAKTLKRKCEFWYCGTPNTWRQRYFKTLKMVLKYKRANDRLFERITVLVGNTNGHA